MTIDIRRIPGAEILGYRDSLGNPRAQAEMEHLAHLEQVLHGLWALGRNIVLAWTPAGRGLDLLVTPHYTVAEFAAGGDTDADARAKELVEKVIAGPKQVSREALDEIAGALGYAATHVELPFVPGEALSFAAVDSLVKRYSLSYVDDRAVALFDIVNFSLIPPLEQVTQLNSLAYSVNAAHSRLLDRDIDISFARTTTGDGFYIWNRDRSIEANIKLYHFMHLVLADNAIARSKARSNSTPRLRTSFHVGNHYEFYQSEGLSPTTFSYIVGDVTIELARMIECAEPGQILVGDFRLPMAAAGSGPAAAVNAIQFIEQTQQTLSSLEGLVLSGDSIESIQCYLTGARQADGGFTVKKYTLTDKHGRTRTAFNAKVNIYRRNADPIYLGVQDSELGGFETGSTASESTRSGA